MPFRVAPYETKGAVYISPWGTYKKVLCDVFTKEGVCPSGDTCNDAHGIEELKRFLFCGPEGVDTLSSPVLGAEPFNYKTVLCRHHELGTCTKGDACTFAHGIAELREKSSFTGPIKPLAPNALGVAISPLGEPRDGAARPGGVGGYKVVLCRYFEQGHCHRGEACTFAHGEAELHRTPRPESPGVVPGFKTAMCAHFQLGGCSKGELCTFAHSPEEIQGYKTKLCRFWQETGTCQRGDLCSFAHGNEDLHSQTKTRLCKFFSEKGFCRNGSSCGFAHGEGEIGQPAPNKPVEENSASDVGGAPANQQNDMTELDLLGHSFGVGLGGFGGAMAYGMPTFGRPATPAVASAATLGVANGSFANASIRGHHSDGGDGRNDSLAPAADAEVLNAWYGNLPRFQGWGASR